MRSIAAISVETKLLLPRQAVALAHSLVFLEENHSPSTAYEISDPDRSWAVNTLENEGAVDYYSFTRAKGDKIQVS